MSVGVIALTAECKPCVRSWEIKCGVEIFPGEKGKYTPNAAPLPRIRSAEAVCEAPVSNA